LGYYVRLLISDYFILNEAQIFIPLTKLRLNLYLKCKKIYNIYFLNRPCSYLSTILIILYTLLYSNYFYCSITDIEKHLLISLIHSNYQNFGLLVY